MARLHSRKKGKSGSKKPLRKTNPNWVQLKPDEIIENSVKLAKQGFSSSQIGIKLRDQFGVPNIKLATGKSLTKILEEGGIKADFPEDLKNLMRKAVRLSTHLSNNVKDKHNMRALELIESKIRRLVKYYKRVEKLPKNWNYTRESAKLVVE
ncbi:MAG: 30S ribosomal protein S15 [Candidatus Thermoplasmatota archaeon]